MPPSMNGATQTEGATSRKATASLSTNKVTALGQNSSKQRLERKLCTVLWTVEKGWENLHKFIVARYRSCRA